MTIDALASTYWIPPIKYYIEHVNMPLDRTKAALLKKRASEYTVVGGILYKRGLYILF